LVLTTKAILPGVSTMSHVALYQEEGDETRILASGQKALPTRIRGICLALRVAGVLWITYSAIFFVLRWSNKALILKNYGFAFSVDLGNVSNTRYAVAFGAVLIYLAIGIGVIVCLWQLTSTYLAGCVFTVDATVALRRLAVACTCWVIAGMFLRVVAASVLIGRAQPILSKGYFVFTSGDLLHLMFAGFLLALARIFKEAAAMAEDQAAIV
jgi:hypothetical protein